MSEQDSNAGAGNSALRTHDSLDRIFKAFFPVRLDSYLSLATVFQIEEIYIKMLVDLKSLSTGDKWICFEHLEAVEKSLLAQNLLWFVRYAFSLRLLLQVVFDNLSESLTSFTNSARNKTLDKAGQQRKNPFALHFRTRTPVSPGR